MGNVHQLILRHGLEDARTQAATKAERHAIDAAAAIMAEEESRLGITHAGFAMTSLPHKRISEGLWKREGHRTTLLVESGRSRAGDLIGVPYGSIARLILLYLQTEAVRTNSPEVELGRSMKSWLGRMSLTTGGKTYQLVTEQARRISACRLTFFTDHENGSELRHNGAFRTPLLSPASSMMINQLFGKIGYGLTRVFGNRFEITRCLYVKKRSEPSEPVVWRLTCIFGLPTGSIPSANPPLSAGLPSMDNLARVFV